MSEAEILSETQIMNIGFPFTSELNEAYDTQPTFRILIDVSESCSMGWFQHGYYIKFNDSVYFIRKKAVSVFYNTQTERLLEFLKRTKREFTVDVKRDKTNSGHQYVQFDDIDFNKGIYTLIDFKVFRSLWQIIEFELYEKSNFPSIARFTGDRLIWYAKVLPKHSLVFTDVAKIKLNEVAKQGHLKVYKIEKDEQFTFPYYLYKTSESLRFFNHEIHQKLDVIPLGSERRIISIPKEAQIVSDDHDPITLPEGLYLLFHPRPQDRVD